jgi:hypothetical protein
VNCLTRIRFRRTSQDRHATARLIGHYLNNATTLVRRESSEFTRRSVRVKSVHATLYKPFDVTTQFGFIDFTARIERDQIGREYAT